MKYFVIQTWEDGNDLDTARYTIVEANSPIEAAKQGSLSMDVARDQKASLKQQGLTIKDWNPRDAPYMYLVGRTEAPAANKSGNMGHLHMYTFEEIVQAYPSLLQ